MVLNWKNIKILIAEDEHINYLFLRELLKKTNATVVHAYNGQEAIDRIKEDPSIKVILMDIKMPVKDGFEATNEIKKINKDIIIIAQTAYAMEEDREKCLNAGCDDYIPKPIDKDLLLQKINNFLKNN